MIIVLATSNKGKVVELNTMLNAYGHSVVSMTELGITEDIQETGSTFMENSYLKAEYVYNRLNGHYCVLAEDSGFCIDDLNGAPGLFSGRFMGNSTDEERNSNINILLDAIPSAEHRCSYVAGMTLIHQNDNNEMTSIYFEGECFGNVTKNARGTNGFAYDPIFETVDYPGKTMAELTMKEKNAISHRGRALQSVVEYLTAS